MLFARWPGFAKGLRAHLRVERFSGGLWRSVSRKALYGVGSTMLKKFFSKYFLEVIPSIVASVVGAYIVTHYINNKPADKPPAAVSSTEVPAAKAAPVAVKAAPPAQKAASIPEKAKSEPSKAEVLKAENAKAEAVRAEKAERARLEKAEKEKAEAALRAERHHLPAVKEKPVAKAASGPAAATPASEANAAVDERRDANEIARAAIARLRGNEPPRAPEPSTSPERAALDNPIYTPGAPPALLQAPVHALPPAAMAPPPAWEASVPIMVPSPPEFAPPAPRRSMAQQAEDRSRPTPPADIPSHPLDLRANGNASVADEVVSAARSVFETVVPR